MCFRWLKRIYHCLRRKCSLRNRGYSREISLSHGGFCSGALSTRHGRASLTCGRGCSVSYTCSPSPCPPLPAPAPYSISGGLSCDTHGDCGVTSGWDGTVGTVPVYGPGVGLGYSGEVVGPGGGTGGSIYHRGDLGTAEPAGYGYTAPLTVTEGSGYYGGGLGYGAGALPGAGCAQMVQQKCPVVQQKCPVVQQKCPVVLPPIKSQQCKQSPQWPPIQKK